MRVLLDARTLGREFSGVGNYVLELIRAFATLDLDAEFLLCVKGPSRLRELTLDARFSFLETRVSHESHPQGDLWEELVLPRRAARHRVDVLHGPAFLIPTRPCGCAKVVTVHDLVAFAYPETIPWKYALYMRWLIRRVVPAATRVIADSESTRDDLERLLRADRGRVDVVRLGVAERFRPPREGDVERLEARLGIRRPYLLFVGNLEPRKNLPGLIEAFRRVRRRHASALRLVVAGKVAWKSGPLLGALAAQDLDGSVQVTGYVEPEDLPALYGGAEALVFPSFWEGFGLPVLEAMSCGTPVVASRVASLPEVAGDAATWVDPASPDSIAAGILSILENPGRRPELVARGIERARAFSWERTARETFAAYERARAEAAP